VKFQKKPWVIGEGGDRVALDEKASVTCYSVKSVNFHV
jgi:hypothetical protein